MHKSNNYKSYVGIFVLIMAFVVVSNILINLYIMVIDKSNKALSINIQDNDKTSLSSELADEIRAKNKGAIIYNEQDGIESVAKGNTDLFIIINRDFESKIKLGSFNDVITVYTSFNPSQSKILLETVSKEVLKFWTNAKIKKDNKDLRIKWNQVYGETKQNISLRNVTVITDDGGNIDQIKSDKDDITPNRNDIKIKVNIIILFLSANGLLYFFSKRIMVHKLKGLKTRVELFKVGGKTLYRNNFFTFLIVVSLESILVYSVVLSIYGASLGFILMLFLKFIAYQLAVFIVTGFTLKVSKSMAVYYALNTSFALICGMIIIMWVFI
ncbi:hypothetical protein SAMN02745248_01313 [Hathewaya proteolytica DSM 3090]|uniref:ABC-2 family transporter protein n=1 Tax=Hathewaya proteolytica DSM 3090 TaxID=1121331 RepID=A0A1M6N8A0_9CLOT|nr:hypothetical protein [Hathewaya proteolytica]SHJ91877.1 hypothetical protein SAMN02745248_01313 [Hathewaya proteolytica DSM 3090]